MHFVVSLNTDIVVGETVLMATGDQELILDSHFCPSSRLEDAQTKRTASTLPAGLFVTDWNALSFLGSPSFVC